MPARISMTKKQRAAAAGPARDRKRDHPPLHAERRGSCRDSQPPHTGNAPEPCPIREAASLEGGRR